MRDKEDVVMEDELQLLDAWKLNGAEQEERIRPLTCGVGHSIFVFGGYTDRHKEVSYLNTAMKFDVKTGGWFVTNLNLF